MMPIYSYSYTFAPDHPRRSDPCGHRWAWLVTHVGNPGEFWDWRIPWTQDEDLVYYFTDRADYTEFVLVWG